MTDTKATQRTAPWLTVLGLAGFWLIVARMLSPQWSVYSQYNYGWAVPCLCAYLLWQRWPNRPEPEVPRFGPTIIPSHCPRCFCCPRA
jgi:hypothetical protein